jgi:hypothetical protein
MPRMILFLSGNYIGHLLAMIIPEFAVTMYNYRPFPFGKLKHLLAHICTVWRLDYTVEVLM